MTGTARFFGVDFPALLAEFLNPTPFVLRSPAKSLFLWRGKWNTSLILKELNLRSQRDGWEPPSLAIFE